MNVFLKRNAVIQYFISEWRFFFFIKSVFVLQKVLKKAQNLNISIKELVVILNQLDNSI